MKATCCKDCADRHYNCWSECVKYKTFKEQDAAEKKNKAKNSVFHAYSGIKWGRIVHNKHIQERRKK